jgi:hypothetical protein
VGHLEIRDRYESVVNPRTADDDKVRPYGNSKSFRAWAVSKCIVQGEDYAPVLNNDPVEGRREAQIRDKDGVARHHLSQVQVLEQKAHNDEDLGIWNQGQDIFTGGSD